MFFLCFLFLALGGQALAQRDERECFLVKGVNKNYQLLSGSRKSEYSTRRMPRNFSKKMKILNRFARAGASNALRAKLTRPSWSEQKTSFLKSPAHDIGLNFTAATIADVIDPLVTPPNLNGAVGAAQYILMTYNVIRSFNKVTGLADGALNIDAASFFGSAVNDVRIAYDRFAMRWLMSCEVSDAESENFGAIMLAVSRDAVISVCSKWDFYTFSNARMMPQLDPLGSGQLDYQQLAVDQRAIYIAADAFDGRGYFYGTSVLVVQKKSLAEESPFGTIFYGLLPGITMGLVSGFVPPADNFDTNPAFGYLVNASCGSSSATYSALFLYRISDQGSRTPSLGRQVKIQVPPYADTRNAPHKGNLFGSAGFLQTGGSFLAAPHVRNKQLYLCHSILVDSVGRGTPRGDRVGIRWYQFDLTGDATGQGKGVETSSTVPALIQWGTLFDDSQESTAPNFYFIPSIMSNKLGDIFIAGTAASLDLCANVVYASRKASDELGLLRGPFFLTTSEQSYNFGPFVNPLNFYIGQRWGDLSSLSVDPVNDLDIWSTQEFAAVENGWGVQVTRLQAV